MKAIWGFSNFSNVNLSMSNLLSGFLYLRAICRSLSFHTFLYSSRPIGEGVKNSHMRSICLLLQVRSAPVSLLGSLSLKADGGLHSRAVAGFLLQ